MRNWTDEKHDEARVLADYYDHPREVSYMSGGPLPWEHLAITLGSALDEIERLRAEREKGEVSDGYHTHNELYHYRMLYNAHAARGWVAQGLPVVKSWRHADGDLCFGGGWFIVTATLPTGQVSNHYEEKHWDLFDVPEVVLPPEWDGHTPEDVADRLEAALGY